MSYLLDKKNKKRKIINIVFCVLILVLLFSFRVSLSKMMSSAVHFIFKPVLVFGNVIGDKFSEIGGSFSSKRVLLRENENLKMKLNEQDFRMSDYNSLVNENLQLKEILNRKKENVNFILSAILAKPNHSLYDTLLIDIGKNQGVTNGNRVFALGNVPIGYVSEVEANSSKVILYTNPGEKTEVIISGKNIYMEMIGSGGGNFEMILPKDLVLEKFTEVVLPGITPYTVAKVETIISDPRESTQKALLTSTVNIQEQKFVEVEK